MGNKFQTEDWVIFCLMLVMSVAIGVISAVKNRRRLTTQDYLLGGRKMSPVAVAISLLGSIVSPISVLGNPTEIYFYGTQITIALLGIILAVTVISQITLPIFYNLKLVSLNEYLERRYKSVALRKLATVVTLLTLFITMGMVLYAPSLALSTVTSLSTFASMVIMGAIVTFYTTIGGVTAVVYTDVLQTLLMLGGVLVVVVLCCIDLGGVGEVWAIAGRGGRLEFFNMDTSPYVRHTFWSTIVFGFFLVFITVGINQTTYQRFASVRTLQISKRLSWFFLVGLWCLWIMFFFSGMVAYATYSTCDPLTSGKINKADQILPFLVTDKLGHVPGVSGIFVAAVYGGMLSTISSMGNSAACIVWEDFLMSLSFFNALKDSSATRVVKILSSFTGVVALALGMLMGNLGNIFRVIHGISSAIMGPLCGVFLGGILLPWLDVKGAFAGFLVSFTFNVWIAVGRFLKTARSPTYLPLSVAGCEESLNTTLDALIYATLNSTFLGSTTARTTSSSDEEADTKDIYDTSYCYNGVIGITITMVVAGLVSLFTGLPCPEDVESGAVNPTCQRLYKRVWYMCQTTRKSFFIEGIEERQDEDVEMSTSMLPQPKSDLDNP